METRIIHSLYIFVFEYLYFQIVFQKSITKFFAEGNSDLHIETLKDDEIMEEEEDEPESQESQESLTSSCVLDPLSQTNDDNEGVVASQDFPA